MEWSGSAAVRFHVRQWSLAKYNTDTGREVNIMIHQYGSERRVTVSFAGPLSRVRMKQGGPMTEDVLEVWRVHEEINSFLLSSIPPEGFAAVTLLKNGKPSTGRTVSRVFAHLHGVRVAHIGREFLKGIPRFETGASPGRAELLEAFRASSRGIEQRLARIVETGERIKDRGGLILLGYLIAHESHHRGQILLALKQSGVRMPEEARFGIWEHWLRPKLRV